MRIRTLLAAAAMTLGGAGAAQATLVTIGPAGYGQWNVFDVADILANSGGLEWIDTNDGSALSFQFSVPTGFVGRLTVVDAGFSGDRFAVGANGAALGTTSAAVNSYPNSIGLDFDAALANPDFSRGLFTLAAGSYSVSGALFASALDDTGAALNSTVGALKLEVAPVPLPGALIPMLSGLGVAAAAIRRRRSA